MDQPGRQSLLDLNMLGDLGICCTSLLFASGLLAGSWWHGGSLLVQHPLVQSTLFILLMLFWHLALVLAGLYRSFRLSTLIEEAYALAQGCLLVTVVTAAWISLHVVALTGRIGWTPTMTVELLLFASACAVLLLLSRVGSHLVLLFLRRRGRNLRYVLIVGTNRRAIRIAEKLAWNRAQGYIVVGFVDDIWHSDAASSVFQSMLIGSPAELAKLLGTLAIDEVVVALPIASAYARIRRILEECSEQGILVRCEVSLFDPVELRSAGHDAPLHFVTLHQSAWSPHALAAKRLLDFTFAACSLTLLLPLFACIALAIKLTSPGPVFFVQERLGIGKRRFKIYKFRTMVPNAEKLIGTVEHLNQTQGPTFKLTDDPRITPLGAFLRRSSLDELPQLINVLLGDMSLVGPRPLPLRDYKGFSDDSHRRRFSVKPGITCLWQVMGRSSIGFTRWMELDMHYIDTWSIWLDMKILFRTINVVLRGDGAA